MRNFCVLNVDLWLSVKLRKWSKEVIPEMVKTAVMVSALCVCGAVSGEMRLAYEVKSADMGGLPVTLRELKAMGYDGVRAKTLRDAEADAFSAALRSNGLALAEMPVSIGQMDEKRVGETAAHCRRLGVDTLLVSGFEGKTSQEWRNLCIGLAEAGRRLASQGIRVAYGNGTYEFENCLQREFPADMLKADREVNVSLDVGAVSASMRDAATWVGDLAGRVPSISVDASAVAAADGEDNEKGWIRMLAAARAAGARWLVVKDGGNAPSMDAARSAAAFMRRIWDAAPPPVKKPRTVMNLVNFVRGCEPRRPMDLVTPLAEQIRCNSRYGVPNTILLQYDAMIRDDIMAAARTADREKTEFGVWIEIVKPLCEAVGIPWRGRNGWAWDWWVTPGFLESYTQEQRAALIDELFRMFREKFGAYPQSVGSWIMDAWSIGYMKEKYGIVAVCVCKEQDVTDAYGLRGGYSNGVYYPSKRNMLSAASDMANAIRVPVFKMLTPDPIYNYGIHYEYVDSRNGRKKRYVVTLEPAALGKNPYIVDWYFRTYTERRGLLNVSYMQTGQENSFGWTQFGVNVGYHSQMEEIVDYAKRGLIEVETLGDTGRRFLADHSENCAQTQVALEDWNGQGRRSVWYNCRNYRANLYQEGNRFYVRDIHKMCDGFAEDHLTTASTNWNEVLYTPPVVDAYMFRSDNAPGMLAFGGEATGMAPRSTGDNEMEVTCFYADGTTTLVRFDESGITVFGTPLEIRMNEEWRSRHGFADGRIDLEFKGFRYSVGCHGRLTPTDDGYRIDPERGRVRLDLSL